MGASPEFGVYAKGRRWNFLPQDKLQTAEIYLNRDYEINLTLLQLFLGTSCVAATLNTQFVIIWKGVHGEGLGFFVTR